jgi:cytochrome c-type biogenesis protein CcmH/NrfG
LKWTHCQNMEIMRMQQEINRNQILKKGTPLWVTIICLFLGFVGGVALSVYKLSPTQERQIQMASDMVQNQGTDPMALAEDSQMIETLEKVVAKDPKNQQTWLQLGNLYFDTNKYENAIAAYNKYLQFDPNNADVITDMGIMYRKSGRPVDAVKAFDRAIEKNPRHETARFNKGIVLFHDLKDTQSAIKAWQELVQVNPDAKAPDGQSVDELLKSLKQIK